MKRQRRPNFTPEEREILINLIEKHRLVVENKKTDGASAQDKNKAWSTITDHFNAITPSHIHRSEESLKIYYKNLKKVVRKNAGDHRKETYLTGGGPEPTPFSVEDNKILSVINTKTVFGLSNTYDSDGLPQGSDENIDLLDGEIDEREATEERCPKSDWKSFKAADLRRPLNKGLIRRDSTVTVPNAGNIEIVYEQGHDIGASSTSQPENLNSKVPFKKGVLEVSTPKNIHSVSRRRPTTTVKALTSSALGEKCEVLADKKLELVNCLKKEHELRIKALELDIKLKQQQLDSYSNQN